MVGICFGHQLIAQALGGKVVKSENGWGVGIYSNKIIAGRDYIPSEQREFDLVASHQDQVVRLPEGGETIAGSDFCPIYMMSIGSHVFSVQGHPEFGKGYARAAMNIKMDILGKSVLNAGLSSLSRTTDASELANWIVNFLKG